MPTVSELRDGLAANLAAIRGLRTSALVPDQVNPPIAVVTLDSITFDESYQRGLDQYRFTVVVVVGRVAERSAQNNLDAYLAPSGSTSIKAAIEADRTLGGKAQTLRVTEAQGGQPAVVGDVTYLTATFTVAVYA